MSDYAEADRWADFLDAERDEENEHTRAKELERWEWLDEKGLPHAFKCNPEAEWFRQMEEEAA